MLMMTSFIVVRQIYLFVVTRFISNTMLSVGFAMPLGWMVAALLLALYYHKQDFSKNKVIGNSANK